MSILSRTRKQKIRDFKSRLASNNGPDRKLGKWELIDVHQIPQDIDYNDEFDFWCSNGLNIYLLRIKKAKEVRYTIVKPNDKEEVTYLIAEIDFVNIEDNIFEKVLIEFEKLGIPK